MKSIRQGVVLAVLAAGASGFAATSPLTADQAAVLQASGTYAMEYSQKLPNFICTQITSRSSSVGTQLAPLNAGVEQYVQKLVRGSPQRVEEKVTFFDQREHYEVVAVDYQKVTGVQHGDFPGAISWGEFGSALRAIFDPRSHAGFTWDRSAELRGRRVDVFAYQIPREFGTQISTQSGALNETIDAGYSGKIWADAETKEILRITAAFDLPTNFPISMVERSVEYRPTVIAGQSYILPFHAEMQMKVGYYMFSNKIEFKGYQKFGVESTIRFDDPAGAPHP